MITRCQFEGCTVQRDSETKECQTMYEWMLPGGVMRTVCERHYCLCEDAQKALPTAVMEFHAWALLHTSHKSEAQFASLQAAEDRVVRLRALEAFVKGE
jgi:hypothetical protein